MSRAIAIFFVLVGHANSLFYARFDYNWFHIAEWERTGGVDFFFVVSGFMIVFVYHKYTGNITKSKEFLLKRLIRIFPLYWLMLLTAIFLYEMFPNVGKMQPLTAIDLFNNLFLTTRTPLLDVTWSLSYILFFYFVFFLYLCVPRVWKFIIPTWFLLILIAQFFYENNEVFLLSFNHIEIGFGCFVAYMTYQNLIKYEKVWLLIGLAGFLFIWCNNIYHFTQVNFMFMYSVFSMFILIGIIGMERNFSYKLPASVTLLGDASYSIYICHGPLIQLYMLIFLWMNLDDMFNLLFLMVGTIVLSTVSSMIIYLTLERPMTKYLQVKLLKQTLIKNKITSKEPLLKKIE
nr:acyltransferase [Pseudalkalibacillus hwajinpoensis]